MANREWQVDPPNSLFAPSLFAGWGPNPRFWPVFGPLFLKLPAFCRYKNRSPGAGFLAPLVFAWIETGSLPTARET